MPRSTVSLPASADPAVWLGVSPAACGLTGPATDGGTARRDTDRLALIASQLQAVVGSQALAQRWLRRRNASLGDKPMNLLKSAHGQVRLLQHLGRFSGN